MDKEFWIFMGMRTVKYLSPFLRSIRSVGFVAYPEYLIFVASLEGIPVQEADRRVGSFRLHFRVYSRYKQMIIFVFSQYLFLSFPVVGHSKFLQLDFQLIILLSP